MVSHAAAVMAIRHLGGCGAIMSCDDMRECTAGYVYPIITDASDVTLCPLMPIGIHQLLLLSIHTHGRCWMLFLLMNRMHALLLYIGLYNVIFAAIYTSTSLRDE